MLRFQPWLVVFDLDGTLIDSSLDLCLAVNAALERVGDQPLPYEAITGYVGDGAATLMRRALAHYPTQNAGPEGGFETPERKFDAAFRHFLAFYREHKLDNTRLYDSVLTSLQQIRARCPKVLMAVLTNKPVGPSREICEALEIAPFFFANYGGDSFSMKKPDPMGLLALMEEARELTHGTPREQLTPGKVVMVGDSAADVFTAKRAGACSLGCRYGLAPEALEQAAPDVFCDSPKAWPDLFSC